MQITTTLLNGEVVVVDVPDATLTAPVRTSVLSTHGVEIEVNAGAVQSGEFYVSSTGSTLTQELILRSGQRLRTGSLGGGTGTAFVLDVGDEVVFGPAPPAMTVEALAALLSATAPEMTPDGVALAPRGDVAWSTYRTHDLVVPVQVSGGQRYLLDIRRAFALGESGQSVGRKVDGGLLSRSEEGEGRHVILETPDHVAYGIPLPGTDPDVLVQSMSGVQVSAG